MNKSNGIFSDNSDICRKITTTHFLLVKVFGQKSIVAPTAPVYYACYVTSYDWVEEKRNEIMLNLFNLRNILEINNIRLVLDFKSTNKDSNILKVDII